jgi:hypothetical protein
VTNPVPNANIDLPMIISRNDSARRIIAGFAADMPTLSELWRHLQAALEDIPILAAQSARLSSELKEARLDLANVLAAARATLAAHAGGEADPLWYLRDELGARPMPYRPRHAKPS